MMKRVDRYGDSTAAGGPGSELYLIFKDGLTRAHAALTTNNDAAALIERLDAEVVEMAKGFKFFF